MNAILKDVLEKIKPAKDEHKRVDKFVDEMLRVAKVISGYDCIICGSIGKLTWLRGDHDIDLFMLFPDVSRKELERKGLEFGKRIVSEMKGRYIIKYAEHPYVHAKINEFNVDIVPCYRIKKGEKIRSAVDRSPLHLEYILENLSPDLRNEVRLLKQFCKGIGVYGSDAKNLGFSGYLCELLVINYGTFTDVIKAAASWPRGKTISFDGGRKFDSPLVVIDPVDKDRNVSANLSEENFMKFVASAKKYLARPDKSYFFPGEPEPLSAQELKALKNRGTKFIAIKMKRPDIIDDTLYPQLRRALKRLSNLLAHNGFRLIRSMEYTNRNMVLVFELEEWDLPDTEKMIGPPVSSKTHSRQFLTKYKSYKPYVEGKRWAVEKKRRFKTADSLLKNFLKKNEKELELNGIPNNIARVMKNSQLLEHDRFWRLANEKGFSVFLRKKYFPAIT